MHMYACIHACTRVRIGVFQAPLLEESRDAALLEERRWLAQRVPTALTCPTTSRSMRLTMVRGRRARIATLRSDIRQNMPCAPLGVVRRVREHAPSRYLRADG